MHFPRSSGVLLHPTSLPGRFGVGDLGAEAHRFIDFLVQSGQQWWQVLPLGPTGYGNSPYACYSSMAGHPLLISLERLQERGLLQDEDFANVPDFPSDRADYDRAYAFKLPLLRKAYEAFKHQASDDEKKAFDQFCESKAFWLDDYALFMAIKDEQKGASWYRWNPELAIREPGAIAQCRDRLSDEILYQKYLQFEFFWQWADIKRHTNDRGISIIGDIPIYVAHDSADVWANPENFKLDRETGEPELMAGVPPDYFSETGQLWGNPVYDWDYLQKSNFKWWIQRFEAMLDLVNYIRIDHFRGFEAYWAVPHGEETAINGEWIEAPGTEFFETLRQDLGNLPILAEDLGTITPEVEELRDTFGFPGMKILQFAFGSDPGNPYLPFNYSTNFVVYTGTHDNDTTIGWYESLSEHEKENLLHYLGCVSPEGIHWDMIRLALGSVAALCILPLQDLMGLGTEARMNVPSQADHNWAWRYRPEMLHNGIRDRLQSLTKTFGRAPADWS
ncbi:4-alpha-glucanotransferase [Myxacorys almedinensis]|uniref:4-alpha-glucanotransferase n=1 Tax=Myxacorys almedinensis A TaxID=2690445 RepID=A0A8J8CJ94_9CYAN|nr:4-alpha-glucanotransferase [Myxacorys almedinensis]NDJ18768.1 4-alpha-glucanotransferase [Myxacorys almedinensis A]